MRMITGGRAYVTLYAALWLIAAILFEGFPWYVLTEGRAHVPAADVCVLIYCAFFMHRRLPAWLLPPAGLLKDLLFGLPPGMYAALYMLIYAPARAAGRVFTRKSGKARMAAAPACAIIAVAPEYLITALLFGQTPDGDYALWRFIATGLCYIPVHLLMRTVRPVRRRARDIYA